MRHAFSEARITFERERAAELRRERSLPAAERAPKVWLDLFIGILNLALSRKRWSIVGSWLNTLSKEERATAALTGSWWGTEGQILKRIKWRGLGGAPQRRGAPAPAPAPAAPPAPEPESEEEEPEWQGPPAPQGGGAAPHVNIQVSINVNNAQSTNGPNPYPGARGSRPGSRAAGSNDAPSSRGRGRR